MEKTILIIAAFLLGAILPIQAGLNTRMGKLAGNPVYGALFSFIIGTIALLAYIIITRQSISWQGIKEAPAYLWLGGVMGACYVAGIILLYPKLGPGLTFGLIVAGQMILSLWLEHKNILVAQQSLINPMKLLGIVLVIGGVVIIRKYS